MSKWNDLENTMTQDEYRNFCRNRNLIDLTMVPQEKKDEIMRVYEGLQIQSNILNYLISKRCTQLISCAEEFQSYEKPAYI